MQLFDGMINGNRVEREEAAPQESAEHSQQEAAVGTSPPEPAAHVMSGPASSSGETVQRPVPRAPKKQQPANSAFMAEFLAQQRQLLHSHERSRQEGVRLMEQLINMHERAAEREERLLNILNELAKK